MVQENRKFKSERIKSSSAANIFFVFNLILQILENKFQLEKEDTNWLLDIAKMRHEDTLSLYPFIKEINENFKHEEKFQILVSAWEVAYADGRLDKHEEHGIRKISDLLYVKHSDFIKAKLR